MIEIKTIDINTVENYQIFTVSAKYQELDQKEKAKVLFQLSRWVTSELVKLVERIS